MPDTATKATDTKAAKTTIIDDAPLFAGLDDFVLIQTEKKKAERPKKAAPPKEKSTQPQAPHATSPERLPQKQPKPRKPRQSDPNSLLLSVAEMCALLSISRATLIRMDNAGKIPGKIKLGGSVRFHRETVEAWLKDLIAPPAP